MKRCAVLILALTFAFSLAAAEPGVANGMFAVALENIRQELQGAPPLPGADRDLPADAIVVARQTIGGAPNGYREFVDKWLPTASAGELMQAYGDASSKPRTIEQPEAAGFKVLPLEEFEMGPLGYDWARLNEKYPAARYVVRLSLPAVDNAGAYAVVRYELIGRDLPPNGRSWGGFRKFEKQNDGSWMAKTGRVGAIWK